jgi:nitric oxide reductase subunit B
MVTHKRTFAQALLDKKTWWLHFAIVSAISIVGLIFLGTWTYTGAPPVVDYVSSAGKTVILENLIVRGKEVFHIKGLMSWGSFWGDGADRGPDFTADALHRTVVSMRTFYEKELQGRQAAVTQTDRDAIAARVAREVHVNSYNEQANHIVLNDAQIYAFEELNEHYTRVFGPYLLRKIFAVCDQLHQRPCRSPRPDRLFLLGRVGFRGESTRRDL